MISSQILFLFRSSERLLAVIFAGLCIYYGYRLFAIVTEKQGEIKLQGKDIKLSFRDVSPGVLFALFGAALLVYIISQDVDVTVTAPDGTRTETRGAAPPSDGELAIQSAEQLYAASLTPQDAETLVSLQTIRTQLRTAVHSTSIALLSNDVESLRTTIRRHVTHPTFTALLDTSSTPHELWYLLESYVTYFVTSHTQYR